MTNALIIFGMGAVGALILLLVSIASSDELLGCLLTLGFLACCGVAGYGIILAIQVAT